MYDEEKDGEIGCCEIQILLGTVRSASSLTHANQISGGNHKENAIDISYLLSENIFGLVEVVAEVRDDCS